VEGQAAVSSRTFSPDCDFILRAYELESGRLLWEDQLDRGDFDQAIPVTAKKGRVFVVGQGGKDCDVLVNNCDALIRVYKANSGQLLWEDQVDSIGTEDAALAVAVAGGKLFAGGRTFEPDGVHITFSSARMTPSRRRCRKDVPRFRPARAEVNMRHLAAG
jgi:hypothetical protein